MIDIDKHEVVVILNRILESELAGVVRYTHYSFLVFGYHPIPIVSWLRALSIYQFSRYPQSFGSGRHLRRSFMAQRRPRVNQESLPRASLAG